MLEEDEDEDGVVASARASWVRSAWRVSFRLWSFAVGVWTGVVGARRESGAGGIDWSSS